MHGKKSFKQLLAILLTVSLMAGMLSVVSVAAEEDGPKENQPLTVSDADFDPEVRKNVLPSDGNDASEDGTFQNAAGGASYGDKDMVRVSIVLEKASTLAAGYEVENIAANAQAMSYRENLRQEQESVTAKVERQVLGGQPLDVVWNLTLAANVISANVEYGLIDQIRKVDGVKDVFVEMRYTPDVIDVDLPNDPNMATSSSMIGSGAAWAAGYTGAGRRIAIIDTGIDDDHQAFNTDAWEYSLTQLAEKAGYSDVEEYKKTLDLLTQDEIAGYIKEGKLNVPTRFGARRLYRSGKVPFGFNYVDVSMIINHDSDTQGGHGSHVAGIAAANAYVPDGEGKYVDALEATHVRGVAPDAQIIVMKVFGKNGGASESDYFAAIEDAIILGCDSANLSLGSAVSGWSNCTYYNDILESLVDSGLVMVASAGNYGPWSSNLTGDDTVKYIYGDDVGLHTGGSPGSYNRTLAVASADNDGYTGSYLTVNGNVVFYNEVINNPSTGVSYKNTPISALVEDGELDYVMFNGFGTEEEFEALKDVLDGKVVALYRGGSVNFSDKANRAAEAGAKAVLVINNVEGTINMDLSELKYELPVVSLAMSDGVYFTEGTHHELEGLKDGYYTGKLKVAGDVTSVTYDKPYTMSTFSSWGVPQSLMLKPEITAPGGNIYSVDGETTGGKAYINESGTSMAAPQVSGMVALMDEVIEDKGYDDLTNLDRRVLATSLLMSTAVPVMEGENYYSVMNQGSGLANIGQAIMAQSYIMMKSDATSYYADGKIKAELGDSKDGKYSWSFTVNNLNGETNSYTLSTDVFTQDYFTEGGETYLDLSTVPLAANVTYFVNGETFVPRAATPADVNRDGETNSADAVALLGYIVGNIAGETLDLTVGDLDHDGKYTSYDAYLILKNMYTEAFEVPAGGSVDVTVNLEVTDTLAAGKAAGAYTNGAYVEGYTFVNPVSSEEGVLDVTHSIPFLGFMGNWTDPSMFDQNSLIKSLYGDKRKPYFTELTETPDGYAYLNNYFSYTDSETDTSYYLMGNPYGVEATNPEAKQAIKSSNYIYRVGFSLIRNAAAMGLIITREDGSIVYATTPACYGQYNYGAYFSSSSNAWYNTGTYMNINRSLGGLGVKEGEKVTVSFVAIPEYYLTEDIIAAKGSEPAFTVTAEEFQKILPQLGEGAFLSTTLTVDDTAPTFIEATKSLTTGALTITASDNENIAYMAVLSRGGAHIYDEVIAPAVNGSGEVEYTFDVGDENIGSKCMVVICDYAGNQTTRMVDYGGKDPDYTGGMFVHTLASTTSSNGEYGGSYWMKIDPETVNFTYNYKGSTATGMEKFCTTDPKEAIYGAEYVDGYVYYISDAHYLNVVPLMEMESPTRIIDLSLFTPDENNLTLTDMAYNYNDHKLYVMGNDYDNTVYSIDPLTGVMEKQYTVDINWEEDNYDPYDTYSNLHTLAIDNEGTFYSITYFSSTKKPSKLVTWTADDEKDDVILAEITGTVAIENAGTAMKDFAQEKFGTLTWDHTNNKLYLMNSSAAGSSTSGSSSAILWNINAETGVAAPANENGAVIYINAKGMFIVPNSSLSGNVDFSDAEAATYLKLSEDSLELMPGGIYPLEYSIGPWTLTDKSVTWSSSDESVAVVDSEGVITAKSQGKATITATSTTNSNLTDKCEITVVDILDIKLTALAYDKDGDGYWYDYGTGDTDELKEVSGPVEHKYISGTLGNDNKLYLHDGNKMYIVDPDTFASKEYGTLGSSWVWVDAAKSTAYNTTGNNGYNLLVIPNGGSSLAVLNTETGAANIVTDAQDLVVGLASSGKGYLAGLAYVKSDEYKSNPRAPQGVPRDYYYAITEGGILLEFKFWLENGTSRYERIGRGTVAGIDLDGASYSNSGVYTSMEYADLDGKPYLILTSYKTGDEKAEMRIISVDEARVMAVAEFDSNVWPVVCNYKYSRIDKLTIKHDDPDNISLYEGQSREYQAALAGFKTDNSLTWASANDDIATVTDEGVITGVSAGTTTITVTSVETEDDTSATLTINVTVKEVPNVTMDGVVYAEEYSHQFDWTPKTDTINIKDDQIDMYPVAATKKDDNTFYFFDDEYNLYEINKEGSTTANTYHWDSASPSPWSIANTSKGLFWVYGPYLALETDPAHPTYKNYINFSSANCYFYALAAKTENWTREYENKQYSGDLILYALDSSDRVWTFYVYFENGKGWGCFSSNEPTDLPVSPYNDDIFPFTSLAVGSDGALYYAMPTGDNVEVYRLEHDTNRWTAAYTGETDDGQFPVMLLDVNTNASAGTDTHSVQMPILTDVYEAETGVMEVLSDETVNRVLGSTESITTVTAEASDGTKSENVVIDKDKNTVTITVSAADTTNGRFTATYDKDLLTLKKAEAMTRYNAVNTSTAGKVDFAFATENRFDKATAVAVLEFTYDEKDEEGLDTTVDLTVSEDGDPAALGAPDPDYPVVEHVDVTIEKPSTPPTPSTPSKPSRPGGSIAPSIPSNPSNPSEPTNPDEPGETKYKFVDVADDAWYAASVYRLYEAGLMDGTGDDKFSPDMELSRAMMVTILYRLAGKPEVEENNKFSDVPAGMWYSKAVAWGEANGIVEGVGDGTYQPDRNVTRQEMATMLWRYAKSAGYDVSANGFVMPDIKDRDAIATWAGEAMSWAVRVGVLRGTDSQMLLPASTAQRSHVAEMLSHFLDLKKAVEVA